MLKRYLVTGLLLRVPHLGFFLMPPRHETVEPDMTVAAALKYIVSMGVVRPVAREEVRTRLLSG